MDKLRKLKELAKDYTILIVDDEKTITLYLKELLSLFFKEITICNDPLEAIKIYQQTSFDIVLTDLTMPKMNGLELIKKIKQIHPQQHILILSAHNRSDFLFEALNLDVDGYLLKPLKKERLFSQFFKTLSSLQAQRVIQNYQEELEKKLQQKEKELRQLYLQDPITKLPNRTALLERLQQNPPKGIILLNIDNFSIYNMLHGYEKADHLLFQIAHFLDQKYPNFYSLGGDNFVFLTYEDPQSFAHQIHKELLNFQTKIDDFTITLTATVSYSTHSPLLRTAMLTLEYLKKSGKNRVGGYDETINTHLHNRIQQYLFLLKESIRKDRIVPFFQPIFNYKTSSILYYEALARMYDEKGALYSPYQFIDIAQLSGLINEITRIMIQKVFHLAAQKNIPFSVNISFNDLEDPTFPSFVQKELQKNRLSPKLITFEVLEDSINISAEKSFHAISQLQEIGFKFALDDFGAKHSNFERIHKINADYIKVDGKYIKDIDTNPKSFQIAKAIINFAKSIDIEIVAEFVLSQKIATILDKLGVRYMQGYLFGKPSKEIKEII